MSLDALNAIFVHTALVRVATLYLPATNGDARAACEAARAIIASYLPQTHDELAITVDIVCHSFHSQAMLANATDPALAPDAATGMLKTGMMLHRQAEKARRSLALVRKQAKADAEQPAAPIPETEPEPAPATVADTQLTQGRKPGGSQATAARPPTHRAEEAYPVTGQAAYTQRRTAGHKAGSAQAYNLQATG
jgi:hypothetical protein